MCDESTRVMCEMVGAVGTQALGTHVGHLALDELRAVEDALAPCSISLSAEH